MTAQPGEMIQVQTQDCHAGRLFVSGLSADDAASMSFDDSNVNPATGPIYIEGAMPGDVLSVMIHHIYSGCRGGARTYAGVGQLHEMSVVCSMNNIETSAECNKFYLNINRRIEVIIINHSINSSID
jgi:acetamidase/formamidase